MTFADHLQKVFAQRGVSVSTLRVLNAPDFTHTTGATA
jgi:hypothetical protein